MALTTQPAVQRIVRSAWLVPACLGLVVGCSFGWPGGWLPIQLCLTALTGLLCRANTPAKAGCALAAFSGAMVCAGHFGFLLGLPDELRGPAGIPFAALVLIHMACAWVVAYATLRPALPLVARMMLVLPSLWMLREWLFSVSELAMPWLRLGYAQAPDGPLAGALPLGGVLLAGWLMLALSGLAVVSMHGVRIRHRLALASAAAVCVLVTMASAGVPWTESSGSLEVALVQSGAGSRHESDEVATPKLLNLYRHAVQASSADLIVTPQLAIPKTLDALPPGYLHDLQAMLERRNADVLLGTYLRNADGSELFNAVLGLGASGVQQYVKRQLFPFGEFMPFGTRVRRWMQSLLPNPRQDMARPQGPGEPLLAKGHRLALAICFEAAFGDSWRRRASTAGLLVNVSSDSAIDSRQFHRQARQIDQTRALELQKPLIRTSDVLGSFVVDHRGRITDELEQGSYGVLQATVVPRTGLTPYARWGDLLALLVATLCLGFAALLPLKGRGRPIGHPGACRARPPVEPRRRSHPNAQAGQVLPLSVVLVLVIAAMFYLMANAGQTIIEKMRVTNAADAAAYSAAVVEARALNHDAYLNRAMVANEIAIAQLVSFASWTDYIANAIDSYGRNAPDLNFFLLPKPRFVRLDALLGGSDFAARHFGTSARQFAELMISRIGPVIAAHDEAIQALSAAQETVHVSLLAGSRQRRIANDIVRAMDPALRAEVIPKSHTFDVFTRRYARRGRSGDERERLADVVVRSRDRFTRERNWTINSHGLLGVRKNPALKRRAGTELIGFEEWRAVDTLELHGRRFGCGRFGLSWCDDIRRPVGWGAIHVGSDGAAAAPGSHGNAYEENPTTARKAQSKTRSPPWATFHGIPDSRGLSDLDPGREIAAGITVRVSKAQASTLTSGNAAAAKPSGRLAIFGDRPAGGLIVGMARAQVFFDRIAPRADGKPEIGSLFNPYWRVRLVAPTAADKAYAATKQAGLIAP